MKFSRPSALAEALRMTRSGKLADATALISAALSANPLAAAHKAAGKTDLPIDLKPVRAVLSGSLPGLAGSTASPATESPPPHGGNSHDRSYSQAGKTLHYRLYVPDNAVEGMPLVVMLHGCTQSADDFARGTGMNALADTLGFLVAYPSQTHAANAQKCWNWFKPSDQQRDQGEPGLIAGLTRQIIAEHHCDPNRVYIAGLSAGGAAAAIMASAYPDLYAAVGIHSGLPCGAARDVMSALTAMKQGGRSAPAGRSKDRFVPVITFHGDRDTTVNEINARDIVSAATAVSSRLATRTESGEVAGGRRYTRELSVNDRGETVIEQWTIHGGGHAWSGGSPSGTYTDKLGPDATSEMMRFFLSHRLGSA